MAKIPDLIELTSKKGLELNSKRNNVVYLYEVVRRYAKTSSEMREKYFMELQNVFMRYLFDKRQFMQDLASKGLSLIYTEGDPAQRELLLTALSEAFSGTGDATKKKEKDENEEILLDFKDSTSTEQREKLKTYKDLVRVANELGQKDLIYQFLEVHRHMSHY
jgi:proteasome component ECM29